MDKELIGSGEAAQEKLAALRAAKKQQQVEQRRSGQTPAQYVRTDANQGLVEVQDIYGGRALLSSQGSLSNRAIAPGEAVRLYQDEKSTGWKAADWKPIEVSVQRAEQKAKATPAPARTNGDDPDEPDPPAPQPEPTPPQPAYCSTQCFWYKGRGYQDPNPPASSGKYLAAGNYRFGDPFGAPGPPFSITLNAVSYTVSPGLSADEIYFAYVNCDGSTSFLGNAFGGVRASTFSLSRIGDFSCSELRSPKPSADPGKWQAICSSNPPISFDIDSSNGRSRITIWDQVTTRANPLAVLDFEQGRYSYSRRCAEEGPP